MARSKGNNRETVAMEPQRAPKSTGGKKSSGGSKSSGKASQKSAPKSSSKPASKAAPKERKKFPREVTAIIMLAIGVFLVLSLHTNVAGALGRYVGGFFKGVFGLGGFVIPYLLIIYSVLMLIRRTPEWKPVRLVWMLIFTMGLTLLNACRFMGNFKLGADSFKTIYSSGVKLDNGGLFGMYVGGGLFKVAGLAGIYITAIVLTVVGFLLLFAPVISIFRERRAHKQEEKEIIDSVAKEDFKEKPVKPSQAAKAERPAPSQMEMDYPMPEMKADPAKKEDDFYSKMREEQRRDSFMKKIGFSGDKKKDNAPPKWPKKMPSNQKDILDLVWNENEFGETINQEGYGLDGSQESLHQPKDFNRAQEKFSWQQPDEPTHFEPEPVPEPVAPTFEKGGESVATAKSSTEDSNTDVSVTPTRRGRYKLPPLDLLKAPSVDTQSTAPAEDLNKKAALLEETLKSFNVEAKVVNVISGPSVTRYEIQPAIGVKVQKITSLSDDIALNMRASSIRIEAPIPGKAAVGIEIENAKREAVTLREIIGSATFRNNKSKLAFSVGRDIGGNAVVADLGKMPHLLIAGATGSGKSVCINTIIASILYKARPEEVKLIMIDPKMVELGNYNGIPHLLIPVVTDANKAASALNWAVAEMTDRYKKFAANGVRDIGAYNMYMKEKGEKEEILPQIVVIIDELSDLMMVASSQVEDAICRLAQLARAAGMHLIVATQRPSVDVITGLIKANIPSRIAFMVSSQIDSRTIIDMPGAEKLVGNGDMLFKPQDLNKPKRIQGPFVSDAEVRNLIEYVKEQSGEAQYDEEVIQQIDKGKDYSGSDEGDELLMDAVGVVVNAGQASVSMLQRRFRIGYNRAARIVDIMEERGIVGPPDGARPRQVLITEAEYDNMKEAGEL